MDTEHTDQPYPLAPPPSRSIYHLSTTPSSSSQTPTSSPSHHLFPTSFDSTTALHSAFLSPSPINSSKLPSLPLSTAQAFTFAHHSSLLPPCPLSPSQSLFEASPLAAADPYIASILSSSPTDEYAFCGDVVEGMPLLSDELSEVLSDGGGVGDIGCVVLGDGASPSSPSCTSPWSNAFDGASAGECESGSGSGGSDSEGRCETTGSEVSSMTIATGERDDTQSTTDDDDNSSAITPTSPPLPHTEPTTTTKRRRKPSTKLAQQHQPTTAPTKGRKRRLTATAAPAAQQQQSDAASEAPEDKRERNKQSASDYRKRRKLYVASLEQQLNELKAALRVEREEGKKLRGENTVLRASMQMMREFVQGSGGGSGSSKPTTPSERKDDSESEEEEGDVSASAEATKRWEAAVSVRVPEEYRPVAPSQKTTMDDDDTVQHATTTHSHNTRQRRGRSANTTSAAGRRGQHKVGLTLFVLFSCFLLYFPWLSELPSPASLLAPNVPASAGGAAGETSLFYRAAPDCVAQPGVCHRGRTILTLLEEDSAGDVDTLFVGQHHEQHDTSSSFELQGVATPVVDVKMEPYTAMDEELSIDQLASTVMSPLSLPISAHNASAALAWLAEHDNNNGNSSIEQLLTMTRTPAASSSALGSSSSLQYQDGGWAAAGYNGAAQQAV